MTRSTRVVSLVPWLAFGVLAGVASGCGGDADSSGAVLAEDSRNVYVVGKQTDGTYLVKVDVASGAFTAFGPALPALPEGDEIRDVWVAPNAHRAIVQVHSAPRAVWFLAGDGSTWRTLTPHEDETDAEIVSDDLSLIWTEGFPTSGGDPPHPRVYPFDGSVAFDLGDASHEANTSGFIAFAPDSSWFAMRHGEGLVVRTRDGEESLVFPSPDQLSYTVAVARSTSLVVADIPNATLTWLDLKGQPVTVGGFDANRDHTIGEYLVDQKALLSYGDRRLDDVIPLDPHITVGRVFASRKGVGAIMSTRDQDATAIDATGKLVDTFTPIPSTKSFRSIDPNTGTRTALSLVMAVSLDAEVRLVALQVDHAISQGTDDGYVERTLDAWVAVGSNEGRAVRLASEVDFNVFFEPQIAAGARAIAWVEGGTLHVFDATTLAQKTIPSPYVLSPVHATVRY